MCEFDPKTLLEMEERLKADFKADIQILFERTRSDLVNPATETRILGIKEEILIEVKKITDKLDLIYPHVQKEIERDRAYSVVMGDANKLTGKAKWVLYALLTWGAIYTYGQTLLKFIVGVK
jgi:hypothetical protein